MTITYKFEFDSITDEDCKEISNTIKQGFESQDLHFIEGDKAVVVISEVMGQEVVVTLRGKKDGGSWVGYLNMIVRVVYQSNRTDKAWRRIEIASYMQPGRVYKEALAEAQNRNFEQMESSVGHDLLVELMDSYADIYFIIWWNTQIDKINNEYATEFGSF